MFIEHDFGCQVENFNLFTLETMATSPALVPHVYSRMFTLETMATSPALGRGEAGCNGF